MSEYEGLREDIATVADSLARYSQAVGRAAGSHDLEIRKLWADNAELRDELHALANRVETLTRAVTTAPAEVAERMVPSAVQPVCICGHRYDHHDHGGGRGSACHRCHCCTYSPQGVEATS